MSLTHTALRVIDTDCRVTSQMARNSGSSFTSPLQIVPIDRPRCRIQGGIRALRQERDWGGSKGIVRRSHACAGPEPNAAEVAHIVSSEPREVDYDTFLTILNWPDDFKLAGPPGM